MTSLPQDDAWPKYTVGLESIPAPAFVTAPDGRIVSANMAATALWGRSPTVLDSCCPDITWLAEDGSPAGHEACPVAAALALRQSTCVGRGLLNGVGPSPLMLECSSAPLRDASGALRGVVSLMRPFSEAEAGDQRLRVALEAANRRKDEFIATLGHELRQPIAPMALALTLLRSDPAPEVSRRALDNLARQLEHLTRLVDDLVDTARVAQGKVTLLLELITLQDALSNAANVAAPEMSRKRLHFDLEMPPEPVYVMADGSRLQQVFSNLLLNAAKFTDPGGRVRVRLRQEGDVSIIEVRDTNRGVAPEMRAKLFDMFMQADTTTGLGIGLPVVKRLVELHGGTVEVTFTSPGSGSEFTVTLPVASVAGSPDRLGS